MLRCYGFPVLLYAMESRTLTETSIKKLEAFEMWLYRRILKVKWIDKISSVKILQWMNKEKEIVHTIKTSKLRYLGHIMRNPQRYQLLQVVLQGKVMGRITNRMEKSLLSPVNAIFSLSYCNRLMKGGKALETIVLL